MKARKLCVVTTSRADYGHLRQLMIKIQQDPGLDLEVVATGMHLMRSQGYTVRNIGADGIRVARNVPMMLANDDDISITKSIGLGLISFAEVLSELEPDILVLLGDRYELFAPAIAALMQRTPIAHIHGGETSQGAIDEAIRHSITKMATFHFPVTRQYAARIRQMGEPPERIFNCGAPGLDSLYASPLLTRPELEQRLSMVLDEAAAIVTYHPVTTEAADTWRQIENLLAALESMPLKVLFTRSNADTQGSLINEDIVGFVRDHDPERYRLMDSVGQQVFLSCLKHMDVMIGNSSSGLIEAPSLQIPVVNIGNRQQGRLRAANVIDVGYDADAIRGAIEKSLSKAFRSQMASVVNPYDEQKDGKASYRIKEVLKSVELSDSCVKKVFVDLEALEP